MAENKEKRVDKIGRVRPRTYSEKSKPPKKARQYLTEPLVADLPYAPRDLQSDTEGSDIEIINVQTSDGPVMIDMNTTLPNDHDNADSEEIEILESLIGNTECLYSETDLDTEDQELISDNKWFELLDTNNENISNDLFDADNESEDLTFPNDSNDKMPIYQGHHMTMCTSMILILLFSMSHNISSAMLSDLLTIISLHSLYPHPGLKSIYAFKQYFANLQSPMTKHYFCTFCMTNVTQTEDTCSNCLRAMSKKGRSYFITIPLEDQIKKILEKEHKALSQRFSRRKKNKDGIEDIYDGRIYNLLSQPGGVLSANFPYNISFTWNTDGIPIFKSSKMSIWPLYLSINELPVNKRMKTENLLLYGLWFGESKPFIPGFTKPLVKVLKKLETEGVDFNLGDEVKNSKAFLLCGTADLPAKSLAMNCNQFNGEYSCLRCLHPGETFKTAKGGCVRIFPFDQSLPKHPARKKSDCVKDCMQAINEKKTVNGLKGPSFLMLFSSYDFIRSTSIDYMHGVLLGITKLMLNLWTSGTHSREHFSISSNVQIIDDRLSQIKPASYITRTPRSIANHLKYWKASEFRTWLFYYSLPVLQGILPQNYLFHFACFVEGIYLLCTDSVKVSDINRSNILLAYFVHMFKSMYGLRYMTLNMHSLLHLPECVQDLGPLWVYSCFSFENANGILTRLFHGTQNIELQIVSSLNVVRNLPQLVNNIEDESCRNFAQKMNSVSQNHVMFYGTASGASPVGKHSNATLTDDVYSKIMSEVGFAPRTYFVYKRISLRGFVLHSVQYTRVQIRNTYTIKFYDSSKEEFSYGLIQYFALVKKCFCVSECKCESPIVAVICLLKVVKPSIIEENFLNVKVNHIVVAKKTSEILAVDSSKIVSVPVNIDYKNSSDYIFLCDVPNLKECD